MPPSRVGSRCSHSRSPVELIAHTWKNALCKSIPMYSRSTAVLLSRLERCRFATNMLRRSSVRMAVSSDHEKTSTCPFRAFVFSWQAELLDVCRLRPDTRGEVRLEVRGPAKAGHYEPSQEHSPSPDKVPSHRESTTRRGGDVRRQTMMRAGCGAAS